MRLTIKESPAVNCEEPTLVLIQTKKHQEMIYKLGGYSRDLDPITKCEKYDIAQNKWSKVPSMRVERAQMSSCSLNGNIFVFFGLTDDEGVLANSIETLDTNNKDSVWRLIDCSKSAKLVRYKPLVFPLNNSAEIVILGGSNHCIEKDDDEDGTDLAFAE